MPHIHCQASVDADREQITFTWAEGPASFEPYSITGMRFHGFSRLAHKAREKLAQLVVDYRNNGLRTSLTIRERCYELADIGYRLYVQIFPNSGEVQEWLQSTQVDSLEMVLDGPRFVPWNVVYDQEPNRESFLAEKDSNPCWMPF